MQTIQPKAAALLISTTQPQLERIPRGLIGNGSPSLQKPATIKPFGDLPRIGKYWHGHGGVYTGIMRGEKGLPDYHLITAVDPLAIVSDIAWADGYDKQHGACSDVDGIANTLYLCASAINHPAAQWASKLCIDGLSDFYLPARHEARLMYINLPGLFDLDDWYWTSTQGAGNADCAWMQDFGDGDQDGDHESDEGSARAVRRILIIE
ncbi:hypothetical protein QN372_00710 [Undibacterium sp. RTI2.1]|uniref:hypothetical protein n=1 Tax=unclassified Undibacterium TaxID=2630295 RepID=UPI002B239ED8|nr:MULTISPECIES: hypothetical protein [unclassified Undibacterium]MEB0029259.1 hypothetical protein [Undibacterium sp. RTI2.1]MEB0115567.1 hypothetical protein [Undibacterium sp. RTI2.2]